MAEPAEPVVVEYSEGGAASAPPPPAPGRGPRVWAAAVLVLAALGLIVLGGCFLVAVLILVEPIARPNANPPSELVPAVGRLMTTLYILVLLCFLGALLLLVLGVRGLVRIIQDKAVSA
jgi:hypothetical protein